MTDDPIPMGDKPMAQDTTRAERGEMDIPRCWHCMGAFSVTPALREIEIEPGRVVQVHKNCYDNVREALRRMNEKLPDRRRKSRC